MIMKNKLCLAVAVSTAISSAAVVSNGLAIEEVVVTAQKRAQSAQDVSIAISAFSGDSIKEMGMGQPIDVAAQTPGMFIKNGIGVANPYITIRNVGQSLFVTNAAQPVGMYMNDINLAYTSLMSLPFYDMERIEVLKGPQGTLFGRNSTAGAMSLYSAKPTAEDSAEVTVQAGSDNLFETNGYINGALAEDLNARLAFSTKNRDGLYKNNLTGNDLGEIEQWATRGSLQWDASEDLSATLVLEAVKDRSGNSPWVTYGTADPSDPQTDANFDRSGTNALGLNEGYGAGNPGNSSGSDACSQSMSRSQLTAANIAGTCVTGLGHSGDKDLYEGEFSLEPIYHNDVYSAMLNLNYDLGEVDLTSVTGWIYSDRILGEEFDGTAAVVADIDYRSVTDVFSQEFRLAGGDEEMNWLAGVYYSKDTVDTKDTYDYADGAFHAKVVEFVQKTETQAVFAHSEWTLTDQLVMIADARFTSEEMTFDGGTSYTNITEPTFSDLGFLDLSDFVADSSLATPLPGEDKTTTNETTWKLGLDYSPNEDVLIYGFVSRGFKSGGFNGTWATADSEMSPYDIESLIDYEVGFKASMLDGSMQLNGGLFYYDYQDLQAFALDSAGNFVVTNIPQTDIIGVELELQWRPMEGLDVRAGASFTDVEIKEVTAGQLDNGILEGNETANAAELMLNGLVRYQWDLSSNLYASIQTDFNYQDDTFFTVQNTRAASQEGFWLANARATVASQDDTWEIGLWVKNLTDKEYVTEMFPDPSTSTFAYNVGAPRTYGASFTYRWQ